MTTEEKDGFTLDDILPVRCCSSLLLFLGSLPGGTSLRLTHSTKPVLQVGEWLQEPALLSAGAQLTILPLLPAPRRMNASERDLPHKTHFDLARCIFLN